MTLILAGSHPCTDYQRLCRLITPYQHRIAGVITSDDPGVAALGYRWAWKHAKPHQRFRANWPQHGRTAGLVRNWAMAQAGDLLLVLGDATAPRLQHLIQCMATMGKPVVTLDDPAASRRDTRRLPPQGGGLASCPLTEGVNPWSTSIPSPSPAT